MSESEWVDLANAPLIADEQWLYAQNGSSEPKPPEDALRIVPLEQFVATEEETAQALLGTSTETILPAGGMLLMYGDGGAGKTTLTVDATCHLGSGMPWLGMEVERPVKVVMIENEGPRGKFRQMLNEKTSGWSGSLAGNVGVLEEPWTKFTLTDPVLRQGLADYIEESETDVAVMGPLVTLGMVGGGTPDEIGVFERLLGMLKALLTRPLAFWIVHHENKAGNVSGSWERVPDTLCHVQARGNGHTSIFWRKARWSSEHHGKTIDLAWKEGRTFEIVEEKERDPYQEMLEAFQENDEWRTAKESGKLIAISEADAKKVLAELVRRGNMVYERGPSGRGATAKCWRLSGALTTLAHLSAPALPPSGRSALGTTPPSCKEGGSPRTSTVKGSSGALEPSAQQTEKCIRCGSMFSRGSGNRGEVCGFCVAGEMS